MKVLFNLLDAGIGGGQSVATLIAASWLGDDHRVGVIAPECGPTTDRLADLGADVYELRFGSLRRPGRLDRAARIARGYDLLYSHTSTPGEILGGVVARLARRPHVIHRHGLPTLHGDRTVAAVQRRAFRLLRGDRFIAVAPHVRSALLELAIPDARIEVVPNGVDVDAIASVPPPGRGDGPPTVGMLGRFDPSKGADLFVDAIRRIEGTRIEPVIGGISGPFGAFERSVRRHAAEARIPIRDVGADGIGFLNELAIVVVPSRREGLAMSLLESMALGKAVVASDIPGNRDHGHGEEPVVLVPSGTPQLLANAIEELVNDPHERERLERRARAHVTEHHRADRMVERVSEIVRAELVRSR